MVGHGSGVWPHSPARPLAPSIKWPSNTRPPPHPVPRMTAKSSFDPAPAPSIASDSARQLASFETRTSRSRAAVRSSWNGRPFIHTAFELRTTPFAGEIDPGMPTPRGPMLAGLVLDVRNEIANGADGAVVVAGVGTRMRSRTSMPSASSAAASILVPPKSIPICKPVRFSCLAPVRGTAPDTPPRSRRTLLTPPLVMPFPLSVLSGSNARRKARTRRCRCTRSWARRTRG